MFTRPSWRPSRSARAFLLAFATSTLLFIATTVYTQTLLRSIDTAAADIAVNAAPSIEHLSAARADLRDVLVGLDQLADAAPSEMPGARAELASARARLDANVRAYLALPAFPGERARWREVDRGLTQFETMLDQATTLASGPRPQAQLEFAERSLRAAANAVAAAMLRVTEINAYHAQRRATEIARARHSAERTTYALEAVTAALGLVAAAIAVRSLSRYEAAQEALRRAAEERAAELDQFAARVAHDIRSPLTTVGLSLQIVGRDDGAISPGARAALERGRRCLDRVLRVVDDLLDFARAGAHPAGGACTAVAPVMAGLLEELAPEADAARVEVRAEPVAALDVACSDGVLTSLLSNLVRNALKHLGDAPERRVAVRVNARGDVVRFEVEDTGPGVPAAQREKIFEPYVRLSVPGPPGLGLGLATVKRLIEAHGGAVGVRPAQAGGSVFWFELPRAGRNTDGARR